MLRIANLAGVFTGLGFVRSDGRHPQPEDCGFVSGPLDIVCSSTTGRIVSVDAPPTNHSMINNVLDGTGLVATAGFIDSHTHALFSGDRTDEHFGRWAGHSYEQITAAGSGIHSTVRATSRATDEELLETLTSRLLAMIRQGSTVVEVKSGYADTPQEERRLLQVIKQARQIPGLPEIRATFLGLHAVPRGWSEVDYCTAMIDILPTIQGEQLADYVDAFPERGFFSLEQSLRFLNAAREYGLPAKVHADELSNLGTSAAAIRLGALSIDHLEEIDNEALELLATSPTVCTLLPATSFFLGIRYADAQRLSDTGARVALATDFNPGSAPSSDWQLTQLLAASQLHMTAAQILCACTFNAAAALGIERTHGAISPGWQANLLLWRCDSLAINEPLRALERLFIQRSLPVQIIMRGRL